MSNPLPGTKAFLVPGSCIGPVLFLFLRSLWESLCFANAKHSESGIGVSRSIECVNIWSLTCDERARHIQCPTEIGFGGPVLTSHRGTFAEFYIAGGNARVIRRTACLKQGLISRARVFELFYGRRVLFCGQQDGSTDCKHIGIDCADTLVLAQQR